MGRGVITDNRGEGLYRVRLDYDTTALETELGRLDEEITEHAELIESAQTTVIKLDDSLNDARKGLDAVIAQWREGVIENPEKPAPPIEPEGPGGEPEEEQADNLFAAINDRRTAAAVATLSRDADLDLAARRTLQQVALTGRSRDLRSSPEGRVVTAGYAYDDAVGVGQAINLGQWTAEKAAEALESALVLEADYDDVGCAYLYIEDYAYAYLWCAIFAAPGSVVTFPENEDAEDPAKKEAEKVDEALKPIEPPRLDPLTPPTLAEVAAAHAKAAQEHIGAQRALALLQLEQAQRQARKSKLEALQTEVATEFDAWCAEYIDDFPVGTTVALAEVPGYYDDTATDRDTGGDIPKSYTERSVNILRGDPKGQIRHAATMSDATVFVNAALEPGWLRWRPLWRYGTVTAIESEGVTIELHELAARRLPDEIANEIPLVIDTAAQRTILTDSASMQCPEAIQVGDEVLVEYADQARAIPVVAGWRREPRQCFEGRVSWFGEPNKKTAPLCTQLVSEGVYENIVECQAALAEADE